jgi:hypothetical protein
MRKIEAEKVLSRFHELPTKDNILIYNFRMWLEGYCATSADQVFWSRVNEQVMKLKQSNSHLHKYQKRIKQLAVQAFAVCGAAQFDLPRRVFVDTVFATLSPNQLEKLNTLLVSQLEESQKFFDVHYYNPHSELLARKLYERRNKIKQLKTF